MSQYEEVIEGDRAYLKEVGMQSLLEHFVADAVESHPPDVYEFMMAWASEKKDKLAKTKQPHMRESEDAEAAQPAPSLAAPVGEYPVEDEGHQRPSHHHHVASAVQPAELPKAEETWDVEAGIPSDAEL